MIFTINVELKKLKIDVVKGPSFLLDELFFQIEAFLSCKTGGEIPPKEAPILKLVNNLSIKAIKQR